MAYFVYILQSETTGRHYAGHSEYPRKRLAEHNANKTVSIKNRGPWKIVYTEEFATRGEAMSRENQIKRMKSRPWIEELVRASR